MTASQKSVPASPQDLQQRAEAEGQFSQSSGESHAVGTMDCRGRGLKAAGYRKEAGKHRVGSTPKGGAPGPQAAPQRPALKVLFSKTSK